MDLGALVGDLSPWLSGRAVAAGRWPERRDLQPRVLARVQDLRNRRATVVLGPRQVGKSVLLLQLAEDLLSGGWPPSRLLYFDFSDDRVVEETTVRDVIDAHERILTGSAVSPREDLPLVLLLDEVSHVPRWDRWLKSAVDSDKFRIVCTDSAASLMREGAQDSGLGRWDEVDLEGLLFSEFRRIAPEADPLSRYLQLGGFPAFASGLSITVARRTLREDIVYKAVERNLVHRIDDISGAKRLFVYLMQDSGAIYNASKRQADLGIHRKQVSAWLELFLDSRLVVSLPRRELDSAGRKRKSASRLGAHPKLYAADHGLIYAFSPLPDPYTDPQVLGQAYEGVVFRHLRALVASEESATLSFHRREGEGDFVVDTESGPVVVEVTSQRAARGKLEKLRKVQEEVGAARALLVYGGIDAREVDGITLVPLPAFLEDPAAVTLGGLS